MRRSALFAAGVAALLVALAAAPVAQAQVVGLYYEEEVKDGRVYVFNTPEAYKSWKDSGEMGKAITLVGRGENGMTVIAENETAADLYFFRHDLEGYDRPTPKPPEPPFSIAWKDGKTTILSKNAALVISNRVQVRFTQEMPEQGDDVGSFRIRRAKTKFEGWVYDKDLTYELQVNWPGSSPQLEDANFNYDFQGDDSVMLKLGQFKVPFGRQELTSSGSQEFVDRSLVSNTFARGRDIGLQLWGTPLGGKVDWRVGLFNGSGVNTSRNDNDQYQIDARLTFQPFGDVKYSEGDFESSDRPLFAIAGQYESNERPVSASGSTPAHDADTEIVGADAVFKYKGLFLFGEYFDATIDRTGLPSVDTDGYNLQAGYFVIPKKLELALRLAELDPNADVGNDEREERGVALGWFFNKHAYKLQADYRQLENNVPAGGSVTNDEFRLQYQIIF